MGQCAAICTNSSKRTDEVVVDTLGDPIQKFCKSPYYSKLIFLQLQIKKYLRRTNSKVKTKATPANVSTQNIDTSANNQLSTENKPTEHAPKVNITKPNNDNSQSQQNNNNIQPAGSSLIIPSVKAEFKESIIFTQDPFTRKKTTSNVNSNDPREGPLDGKRRTYPKIIEDDSTYEGEWKNGKRDGLGILCFKDVSKYIGEFKDGKVDGFGKLWHEDGDVYTGYWKEFQVQGIGIYQTIRDASYSGYWDKDKQSGFGIEKWPRGSNYIGEYSEGNKEGYGMLNFEGNGGYEGEFKEGSINGVGTFYFRDNRKYEGEWQKNKMHGFGIITWPDGKFYEGEFKEDKKDGFGVFYSQRKIYLGIWRNSLLEGDIIIVENGKIKKQFWENGRAVRNLPPDKPIFFEKFVEEIIEYKDKVTKANMMG